MTKASELTHLFRALKAPAAARATPKLADRAREESWSHERFLEAVLSTEVASRESHGGRLKDQGRALWRPQDTRGVGIAASRRRALDAGHGVLGRPPSFDGVREDPVQEVQLVDHPSGRANPRRRAS